MRFDFRVHARFVTGGTVTLSTAPRQSTRGKLSPETSSFISAPVARRVATIWSAVSRGLASSIRQIAPEIWGVACEVPEIAAFPPVLPVLTMFSPGARISSRADRLVKVEMVPGEMSSVEPTEMTSFMQEGRASESLLPLFPEAARTRIPSSWAAATAPAIPSWASLQLCS